MLPVPASLSSAGLKVMIPNGGMLPPWDTALILLIWKLRLPPERLGPLMSLDQQAKEGITLLAEMIKTDNPGEIGLLLHNEIRTISRIWDVLWGAS